MAKKKKKEERLKGSPISKEEYSSMVLKMHHGLKCENDVTFQHVKIDFYFPEKQMGITYNQLHRDDELWMLYEHDIWIRQLSPFEVSGEDDVEFIWEQ